MGRSRLAEAVSLAVAVVGCAAPARVARTPAPDEPHVTLMTYNVNYGLPGDPSTLAAIAQADPDAVFLQETTEAWEQALRARLGTRYAHVRFRHCCGAGGLGVLSKYPLSEQAYLEPPEGGWFPAWVVTLSTPLGELGVMNVHLRPQLSESGSVVSGYFSTPPVRRAEMAHYLEQLGASPPTLVVGDFNEGDGGGAIAVLEDAGYRSGLHEFDSSADTWRWQTSLGTLEKRLDHVVYAKRLTPLDVHVIDAGRSDHLPVVATFTRSPH